MFSDLTPADVRAAAGRIASLARRTPLRRSPTLSEAAGGDVWLKLETEQVTGSFKIRGALNTLLSLSEAERRRGVVTSSAGNHGLGVAYAARHVGAPATIFVPATAPRVKKEGIASLGATVDDEAPDYDAAMARAMAWAAERGLPFINPCLGDPLLAGQGTVALEIVEELPAVRSVVTCVGGGGLTGGMGAFLRGERPDVRIHGAQSEATPAMARSLAAGQVVAVPVVPTLADGLAGQIDAEALEIGQRALDEIVLVSEEDIARTIVRLHREEGITAEGAGAVAAAAVLHGALSDLRFPAVTVISGGNIDPERLASLERAVGA